MSSAKFHKAQKLIKQKKYNEARAILETINHPMALDLINQIEQRVMRDLQELGLKAARSQRKWKGRNRLSCVSALPPL